MGKAAVPQVSSRARKRPLKGDRERMSLLNVIPGLLLSIFSSISWWMCHFPPCQLLLKCWRGGMSKTPSRLAQALLRSFSRDLS